MASSLASQTASHPGRTSWGLRARCLAGDTSGMDTRVCTSPRPRRIKRLMKQPWKLKSSFPLNSVATDPVLYNLLFNQKIKLCLLTNLMQEPKTKCNICSPTLSRINLVYGVHVVVSATWNSHLEEVGARLGALGYSKPRDGREKRPPSPCYFHGHPLDSLDWFIPHTRAALLTWMKNSHIKLKLAAHLLHGVQETRIVHLGIGTKLLLDWGLSCTKNWFIFGCLWKRIETEHCQIWMEVMEVIMMIKLHQIVCLHCGH